MTQSVEQRLTDLTDHETRFVLGSFDHRDAWRLGTQLVQRAQHDEAAVIIDIRRPGVVLFRAALPGTTAENEAWLDRKAATVFRFETSTALLAARFASQGVDPWTATWFDTTVFAPAGGGFPVRVEGVGVVAAITVSGLTSDQDHDLVVAGLDAYLADATQR